MNLTKKLTFFGLALLLASCASNKQVEITGETNTPNKPNAEITNTHWKLIAIGDSAYQHSGQNREPHLKLQAENKVASGFSGCNSFTGSFEMYGQALTFTPLAATQRACIEGMEIEPAYLSGLQSVTRFSIQGDSLTLYSNDQVVLKFEAVYF